MANGNSRKARAKAIQTRKRNAAKRLAGLRKTSFGRLQADGATSAHHTRRRLLWLAAVRQIPLEELPKAPHKLTDELQDFIEKHNLSMDWLFCGDLKGLQRMSDWSWQQARAQPVDDLGAQLRREKLLLMLTPAQRKIVEEEVRRMLAERQGTKEPEPA